MTIHVCASCLKRCSGPYCSSTCRDADAAWLRKRQRANQEAK